MNKKIIFWIDSKLIYFGLAYYLQKKTNADFFAIIDITNKTKKFFENQELVNFQKKWFYFDHVKLKKSKPDLEYLSYIEKKYGLNLWELAINERIFYRFNKFHKFSTDEILSILEQECKLFEKIIDEIKPTYLITKETIQHKDHIFYEMCKKSGTKILMLSQPKIGYRCIISSEPQKFDFRKKLDEIECKNRSYDDILKWFNSFSTLKQQKDFTSTFTTSKSNRLKAALQFLTTNNSNPETHYTYYGRSKLRVLINEINSVLNKNRRESFMKKNFLTKIDNNEKFVYFPLAVDEERNLLLGAPFYTNQIENIRHVVKSLPADYKLYVKETPSHVNRQWRDISEYEEMMSIPNVRLIHPSVSPNEIYKKTSLVITIAGSSALEAAFHKKPSIVFNELTYSILPSVYTVKSFNELSNAIRISLNKTVDEADLDRYITLLDENSFVFDQFELETMEHDYFFFGGHLIDVDIDSSAMEYYFTRNELVFEKLASEFFKKLNF